MEKRDCALLKKVWASKNEAHICIIFCKSWDYSNAIAVVVDGTWRHGYISYPERENGEWVGVFNPPSDDEEVTWAEKAQVITKKIRRRIEDSLRKLGVGPWFQELAAFFAADFVRL